MAVRLTTKKILSNAMIKHTAFIRGNLSGKYWFMDSFGQLPQIYIDQLKAAYDSSQVYVVFSYKTPIAWCTLRNPGEWVIPDVRYSVTTSQHQSLVRVEAHNPGFYLQFA